MAGKGGHWPIAVMGESGPGALVSVNDYAHSSVQAFVE